MFRFFPDNYNWSLAVALASAMGGELSEIDRRVPSTGTDRGRGSQRRVATGVVRRVDRDRRSRGDPRCS